MRSGNLSVRQKIPMPIIALLSELLPDVETHATMDSLFMHADAPGDPPEGSKPQKVQDWLRRVNKDLSVDPLTVLGQLVEGYMELEVDEWEPEHSLLSRKSAAGKKIAAALTKHNLRYINGGQVVGEAVASPSRTLQEIIRGRDFASIDEEFSRALQTVESKPKEAVSAACNILESVCKIYLEDEGLGLPKDLSLQPLWNAVRKDLGFDPSLIEDSDLKQILTGLISTVNGIGALRSHASSAHGVGRKPLKIKARHARLAVHAAHTVVAFILESWDEKK